MFKRNKRSVGEEPVDDPEYTPIDTDDTTSSTSNTADSKNSNNSTMTSNQMDDVSAKLELVLAKLTVSEQRQKESEDQIKSLTENLNKFQSIETPLPYSNITTKLTSGDQIQLDAYKAIPEFGGDQKQYRSWREQVVRRMDLINEYKEHPKYEAALGIIRAKITGIASEILINNDTKYNINAIVDRLDFSYADQRPLYVVEAEMTTIRQGSKTLQEYYDSINRALNMVITKIVMTYKQREEQKSLTEQMQQKAVRAFIIGLKSTATRGILYGQSPKSLSTAFAIAQTVYYDSQYLQLEQRNEPFKAPMHSQQHNSPMKYNPNFNYNKQPQQQQQQVKEFKKTEPMEVDSSNKYKFNTQNGQKREYNSSQQRFTQPNKIQRINQLRDDELQPINEDFDSNEEHQTIPEDLISNVSDKTTTASAFLGV